MIIIIDLSRIYRAHNQERSRINVPPIKSDSGLERIVAADPNTCRSGHGSSIGRQVMGK